MSPEAVLVPAGILEVATKQLTIVFGASRGTSDFMADCLDLWWSKRCAVHAQIRRLQIDLDNGPEIASCRTQFMKRLIEFSDRTGLEVELVYYPPDHSKYNLVERCWGILEQHWNGSLLSTMETALSWAGTMTWHGIRPLIHQLHDVYERGVKLTETEFQPFAERLLRSETLPKWSLTIKPNLG